MASTNCPSDSDSSGGVTLLSAGERRKARKSARRRKQRADKQRNVVADDDHEPWPKLATEDRPGRGLHGYEWWRAIGSPRFVCAPMVGGSSLPFRMLVRQYGVDLAFSPMIDARGWLAASRSSRRDTFLWSAPAVGDMPLVAQLAGDDPEIIVAAARDVATQCDAVDLNCGCPQPCAEFGKYGAFLLSQPEVILKIVREVVATVEVPMTVKLRKPSDRPEDTLALAQQLESAGASALTIHGRTKEQINKSKGASDWDVVAAVKRSANIPIILNGGIGSRTDALRAFHATGCDAVMSAEALLERPTLFAENPPSSQDAVVCDFLELARTYHAPARTVSYHLFLLLHGAFQRYPDLLRSAPDWGSIDSWAACAAEVRKRNEASNYVDATTCPGPWYMRHGVDSQPA